MEEKDLPYLFPPPLTKEELHEAKSSFIKNGAKYMEDSYLLYDYKDVYKRSLIKLILRYSIPIPMALSFALHLYHGIKDKNLQHITEDVSNLCFAFTGFFCIIVTTYYQEELDLTLNILKDASELGIPPNYYKFCKIHDLISIFSKFVIILTILGYAGIRQLQIPQCREYNKLHNKSEFCEVLFPMHIPFNYDYTPVKQIIYVYEVISAWITILPAVISTVIQMLLIHHFVLRLTHVKLMIQEINTIDPKNTALLRKSFIRVAKYHQSLKASVDNLNAISRLDNLLVMVLGAICIAINCLTVMIYRDLRAGFPLFIWTVAVLLPSIIAQWMMDAEEDIYAELLNLNWHEFNSECKFFVLMLIGKLQHPMCISVGPFTILGHEYFLARAKETFSYVTLIHQFLTIEE